MVERLTPSVDHPERLDAHLTWRPDPSLGALDIDLRALFAELLGDRDDAAAAPAPMR